MQMYQILSLNSLILAYSLSVLHLDGVKYGDMQVRVWWGAESGVIPLTTHTYRLRLSVSLHPPMLQLTALGILNSISFISMSNSQPLPGLSKVRAPTSIFHPSLFFSLLGQFVMHVGSLHLAVTLTKRTLGDFRPPPPKAEFKPSLLNSVVFLASAIQHLSVFVVNLKV